MAGKAKAGELGEAGVAKAWRLVGGKSQTNQRSGSDAAKAACHADTAEKQTKLLEQRLKKLEAKLGLPRQQSRPPRSGPHSKSGVWLRRLLRPRWRRKLRSWSRRPRG